MENKTEYIEYGELFNITFMKKYTSFKTINEFVEKCGGLESEKIKEIELIVKANTEFSSWKEMQIRAIEEYHANELLKTLAEILK